MLSSGPRRNRIVVCSCAFFMRTYLDNQEKVCSRISVSINLPVHNVNDKQLVDEGREECMGRRCHGVWELLQICVHPFVIKADHQTMGMDIIQYSNHWTQ